jgi:tRNA U34 2-thiouridine synthase MnmA/TrmU
MGAPLHVVSAEAEFLAIVRQPRHGYGGGLNPCLDCHTLIVRKAAERMREVGAALVFTGEVLGERPMSQHQIGLDLVERKSGLAGRLLRPLSALHLPPTIPEREGLVDRGRLLDIHGRSRLRQLALARFYGIDKFPPPAGGCLLTLKEPVRRVRDLLAHVPEFSANDFQLAQLGRHFRLSPQARLVVGRDQAENGRLVELAQAGDLFLEVRDGGSPVALLRGPAPDEVLRLAAAITARYSDVRTPTVVVHYGTHYPALDRTAAVERAREELVDSLRI